MPKRRITNASTSTSTACTKRERRSLMGSLEREEERHEVDVFLGCEPRAEVLRHDAGRIVGDRPRAFRVEDLLHDVVRRLEDRKSTRLNSSHSQISYAVFCLKKKK